MKQTSESIISDVSIRSSENDGQHLLQTEFGCSVGPDLKLDINLERITSRIWIWITEIRMSRQRGKFRRDEAVRSALPV